LQQFVPDASTNRLIAMGIILVLRLAAIGWKLRLPVFKSRDTHP
jgi:uncharacterized membrane protein YeiH